MAGGERQRVFWKQQYEGTQGIVYIVDATTAPEDREKSLVELDKVIKQFPLNIPVTVGLTKIDQLQLIEWNNYKMVLGKSLQ